jgi:hypothetical protein
VQHGDAARQVRLYGGCTRIRKIYFADVAMPCVALVFTLAKRRDSREQKRGDAGDDRAQFHDEFPAFGKFRGRNNTCTEAGAKGQESFFQPIGRSMAHAGCLLTIASASDDQLSRRQSRKKHERRVLAG